MIKLNCFVACVFTFTGTDLLSQNYNSTLLKADKLYINKAYSVAVAHYVKYLEKHPRDYYASRQAAICYDKLNDPNNAIDHWPVAVESSEATEKDYLAYGRSLLANNRGPEAKKIFMVLSRSTNKAIAAWGKMYMNPAALFRDSASCKVTEVNGINSQLSERCPVVFKERLFYITDKQGGIRMFNATSQTGLQTISGALKKDSVTLFPTIIYEKLHTRPVQESFCFSPDGLTLYFTRAVSNAELKIKSTDPFYRYQLFALTLSTIDHVQPEVRPFKFNSPDYDVIHPCLSVDGKRLFFASNMKGTSGGKDIFVCERVGGEWGTPRNAGQSVNTPGNEVYPHLSDAGTLYFASDQRPGLGGLDIFYAEPSAEKDHLFKEAVNAGAKLNSRFDDFGIYVLKGENRGYLSSNRKNNTDDDIYYFNRHR